MSFGFKNRLCINRETIRHDKMPELSSNLYTELLRYKTQEMNYFPQPIDLSNYRESLIKKAA